MKKIKIYVDGMSCGGCANGVVSSVKSLEGVKKVKVSLNDKDAVVKVSNDVRIEDIRSKIKEAGYKPGEVLEK
jgi:copper chaperone CopZ